ncbi:hypothetical protein CQW23_01801 [Capsicum baccatum]|uniref:G-patch domain-containing protein n=1 Tax=Capsicum baccatum TaxID=33114 RepID=A0A2G2XPM9_CAPBA|nr:hypothetical protein CQW23_01801 [Capsicum baccatum]
MQVRNTNEKIKPVQINILSAVKIFELEMLKYGYHPKKRLGPKANGIVEPIKLKHQRGTIGLGYELSFEGVCSEGLGVTMFVPAQLLVLEQVVDEDIIEGIKFCFVAGIEGEPEMNFKKLTIRVVEPGEVLWN